MKKKMKNSRVTVPTELKNGLPENISEYIESVTLRKKLLGVSEEDLWIIVSNIQKYYERKAEHDAAVIGNLTREARAKDELIAKQSIYVNAAREARHGA